jgi:hypothetical protein
MGGALAYHRAARSEGDIQHTPIALRPVDWHSPSS